MTDPSPSAPEPSAAEWLAAFAERIGRSAPDPATVDVLLELAGVAAHASERIAAPIACWLVGATDLTPDEALAIARSLFPEDD